MLEMIGGCVNTAVSYLNQGKIVAFPTETYYGLAVDPDNSEAVKRLYQVKKRKSAKPLLLLVDDTIQLAELVEYVPHQFIPLMEKYWPGALTLVFPAKQDVSRIITGGTDSIGIRISPHPLASQLVKTFGKPVTATSANVSGWLPATAVHEIVEMFGNNIDYILEGGTADAGLSSTILAIRNSRLTILRDGQVQLDEDDLSQ